MIRQLRKFDEDVLAVFEDNGTTVTFITADSFALGEQFYKLLTWTDNSMTIGIANEVLNEGMEEIIANQIATDVDDMEAEDYSNSEIRSYINKQAVEYLGDQLSVILDEILKSENPTETNLQSTVERILDSKFED